MSVSFARSRKITPTQVITTNVDELLEQKLSTPSILPTDFERVRRLLMERGPFVAKLHGSISQVESLIFTEEDYAELAKRQSILSALTAIFQLSTVVFFGYCLRDEHVLDSIRKGADLASLFGIGPHFICRSNVTTALPDSVRTVRYKPDPHRDHRSSIQLLEELDLRKGVVSTTRDINVRHVTNAGVSLHMLSDVLPPGTWDTSQTVTLNTPTGEDIVIHVGHGLTLPELPLTHSTAMHDFAVGLICFDQMIAPLSALARLHTLLGAGRFEQIVRLGALRFVRLRSAEFVRYEDESKDLIGMMGSVVLPEATDHLGTEVPVREVLMRQIKPVAGREAEADALLSVLETQLLDPMATDATSIPQLVHDLLLRPSVRQMLGMSGGVPVGAIPRWLMFPVLRLAQVVRLGLVCDLVGINSAKFEFGSDRLAAAAFSASYGKEFASHLASYVVAGAFSTDIGAYILERPGVLDDILRFRETNVGVELRRTVAESLASNAGAEVTSAINSALGQTIPLQVLEQARSKFARLSVPQDYRSYPAIWIDDTTSATALGLWRKKASGEFDRLCAVRHIGTYDRCPCGSGEKLRFCCGEALAGTRGVI